MNSLLEAVRKACPPGLYTQGVNLARDGAVVVEEESPSEMTLRIRAPGTAVAPTVVLYLKEDEWGCDCGGKFDPCQHVAAAAIFVSQGASTAPVVKKKKESKSANAAKAEKPSKE